MPRTTVRSETVLIIAPLARDAEVMSSALAGVGIATEICGEVAEVTTRVSHDAAVIRDTGIDIPPGLLPRVFDLFVQSGRAIERTQGGLGIGLTLVRRLVELHGGSVHVSSGGVGQGSAFTVRLPAVAPSPHATQKSTPADATARRRVLLVDDNDDARQMIQFMLRQAGHEVYEAVDGLAGVETAFRERPDIAIVDVGLPNFNGYEVAQRIRANPETNGMVLVRSTSISSGA